MDFFESLKLSLSNLFSYKVRSFLTMLGIIIGIGAVIMMSSLGAGMKQNITGDLNKLGVGNFNVSIDTSPGQTYKSEDLMTEKDIENIKKIEEVEAVSPTSSAFARIEVDGNTKMFMGTGVTQDYFKISNFTIVKGRKFLPSEYKKDGRFIIIDSSTAEQLYPDENPIGKKVTLNFKKNRYELVIVGVYKDPYSSLNFGGGGGAPSSGLIPNQFLVFVNGGEQNKFEELQVKVASANSLNIAMAEVKDLMSRRGSSPDIYNVRSESSGLDQFNNILNMVTLFISGVAGISLFVGGIGVMNIMLVSVTERIREVGLRKALGARTKDILVQFLIEAVILTFFGGIIGVIIGYSLALLIGIFIKTSPILSPGVVFVCIFVSTMLGLVFGVYPAKKAAKLEPMEALRTD